MRQVIEKRFCDRCGKELLDIYNVRRIKFLDVAQNFFAAKSINDYEIDLCDNCMFSFVNWWGLADKEDE